MKLDSEDLLLASLDDSPPEELGSSEVIELESLTVDDDSGARSEADMGSELLETLIGVS